MTVSVPNSIASSRVQEALTERYQRLEKAADQTIQSFANLIDELSKLKKDSAGSNVKDQVAKLTGEMNNSSVYITKMLAEQMKLIHSTINPETLALETTEDIV